MSENVTVSSTKRLIESAIMVAIGTVLSVIKLIDMPYGGSVTIGAMLPVIIIAYRHGVKWGLVTGFVYGLLQQLLGLDNLSYVTTAISVIAVILLDYIIAYMVTGFGGVFRKISSQRLALVYGAILVCALRYICHLISGATVWAGLPIPTGAALAYSAGYNATYMIPETIVTAILAYYVGSVLDFRSEKILHIAKNKREKFPVSAWIGGLILSAVLLFDIRNIFMHLQNADSGDFDLSGFASVNWTLLAIVTAVGIVISCVLFYCETRKNNG